MLITHVTLLVMPQLLMLSLTDAEKILQFPLVLPPAALLNK